MTDVNLPSCQIAQWPPFKGQPKTVFGLLLVPIFLVGTGCPEDPEFEQLNVEDDCLVVIVSPDAEAAAAVDDPWSVKSPQADDGQSGDLASIQLTSRPGVFSEEEIGTASVTPSTGPAGTRFALAVELNDTGEEQGNPMAVIDRVTVKVDNGSLTLHEFELDPSPADERNWTITLAAGGDPESSTRNDSLCVALYASVE
ncbi:MAG: hypothetical protein CL928_08275 [Deltaproteobacteria bacterium]|nr:hypothetical protein [Deltaproteobacteria bacterium]